MQGHQERYATALGGVRLHVVFGGLKELEAFHLYLLVGVEPGFL